MATEYLAVGLKVDIQRSDGRIHPAIVAKIDNTNIQVEWCEEGQSYAKDIDLEIIESLNPNFFVSKSEDNQEKDESTPQATALVETVTVPDSQANQSEFSQISNKSQNGLSKKAKLENRLLKNETIAARKTVRIPTTSTTAVMNSRRSRVVEEAEFLKKSRLERRKKQEEEKNRKAAFLNMGGGNPNWVLLNMIKEYTQKLEIEPTCHDDSIPDCSIRVCVRKRPLSSKETSRKEVDIVTIPNKNQIIVHEPKCKVDLKKYLDNQTFYFDYVFNETSSNDFVYKYSAQPLVKSIFEGAFSTCFAYGQTGSGKTHTMGGDLNQNSQDSQGIYAMAATDVFALRNLPKYKKCKYMVSASFFEIYSEKVFDLLNNKAQLRILEDGNMQVQVVGLTETVVSSVEQVLGLIKKGSNARTSAKTFTNINSSRSHSVFQIILRTSQRSLNIHGKFSLIDLAGNERGADTQASDRQTRMEGAEINKSLLALKECIRALGRKGAHLPFRSSKLTHVLRDSFIGANSKTCMIAMLSPGNTSCEHSLNTLRYAARVKEIDTNNLPTSSNSKQTLSNNISETVDALQKSVDENILVIAEAEENMIDKQKELLENFSEFTREMATLLEDAETTYDQSEYCDKWKKLIKKSMSVLFETREITDDFHKRVELFNSKIKKLP